MILSLTTSLSLSKNLGNYGQIFPIAELDLRQVLMNRLRALEASGELEHYKEVIINRVTEHIISPKQTHLPTTTTPSTFKVDPTVIVSQDIATPNGRFVAKAGTQVNPFEHIHFSKTLFFFNADDKRQVAWVKRHYKDYEQVKFILTGGNVQEASLVFGRVYFDLEGYLSNQLQLKHVPSVVYQDGLSWRIKEIGAHDA